MTQKNNLRAQLSAVAATCCLSILAFGIAWAIARITHGPFNIESHGPMESMFTSILGFMTAFNYGRFKPWFVERS